MPYDGSTDDWFNYYLDLNSFVGRSSNNSPAVNLLEFIPSLLNLFDLNNTNTFI